MRFFVLFFRLFAIRRSISVWMNQSWVQTLFLFSSRHNTSRNGLATHPRLHLRRIGPGVNTGGRPVRKRQTAKEAHQHGSRQWCEVTQKRISSSNHHLLKYSLYTICWGISSNLSSRECFIAIFNTFQKGKSGNPTPSHPAPHPKGASRPRVSPEFQARANLQKQQKRGSSENSPTRHHAKQRCCFFLFFFGLWVQLGCFFFFKW